MVGMPPSGGGNETSATCPVQADRVFDPPSLVELGTHECVGVGGGSGDAQVESNGVVAVGGRKGGRERGLVEQPWATDEQEGKRRGEKSTQKEGKD